MSRRLQTSVFVVLTSILLHSVGQARPREAAPLESVRPSSSTGAEIAAEATRTSPLRADTTWFGSVDAEGMAVPGETWTFDHGLPDPLEGWTSIDVTRNERAYGQRITEATWAAEGNPAPAPILEGAASLWFGLHQTEADSLCWAGGLGYGHWWCQRLVSPVLGYAGSGDVSLSMTYFNDTELNFDYTHVLLRLADGEEIQLNGDGFTDQIGLSPSHPDEPPTGAIFSTVLDESDFRGETSFEVVFELDSDSSWSDEDGRYATDLGPFGVDDISLTGAVVGDSLLFDFESGLDGFVAVFCEGAYEDMGVDDLSVYEPADPNGCALSGKVLGFHPEDFEWPEDYHWERALSPVVDLTPVGPGPHEVLARWDIYDDAPFNNSYYGPRHRVGWSYYPYFCPTTGRPIWSPRVGANIWRYSDGPDCRAGWILAEESEVPAGVQQVRLVLDYEYDCHNPFIYCHAGPYPGKTPIFDNLRVGVIPGDPSGVEPAGGGADAHVSTRFIGIQPNPVTGPAMIRFSLASPGPVRVVLFDAGGREVSVLFDDLATAGPHTLPWSRIDGTGRRLAAGVYWAQLQVPGETLSRKLVLLRE